MPIENNEANREKLAQAVVEDADLDDLIGMSLNSCVSRYERDEGKFQEDWESVFGDQQIPEKPCDDGSIAIPS
jgi:hypothetical protein